MKLETPTVAAQAPRPPAAVAGGRPRLWPAVVLIALFWVAFVLVGALEKPYFIGFLYGMAAPAVLLLLFSVWWWCNRRMPLGDRAYGCLLVVALGVAVAPFCHRSV